MILLCDQLSPKDEVITSKYSQEEIAKCKTSYHNILEQYDDEGLLTIFGLLIYQSSTYK